MKKVGLLFCLFIPALAKAQDAIDPIGSVAAASSNIHTDFSCSPPPRHNPLASAICTNKPAADAEFNFSRVYYALRNQVDQAGLLPLKKQVIADEKDIDEKCNIPEPGQSDHPLDNEQRECYIQGISALAEKYSSQLSNSGNYEYSRSVEDHIALQQKLMDLGYLSSTSPADGIYGEATRNSIKKWQKDHSYSDDGFVTPDEYKEIMEAINSSDLLSSNVKDTTVGSSPSLRKESSVDYQQDMHVSENKNNVSFNLLFWPCFFLLTAFAYKVIPHIIKYNKQKRENEERNIYEVKRRKNEERILFLINDEIIKQKRNLQISKSQKVTRDMYGTPINDDWFKEIYYFFNTRIKPIIDRNTASDITKENLKERSLKIIIDVTNAPIEESIITIEQNYISSPLSFDPRMDPFDYEEHCALLLKSAGWTAQATQKSGDQGADVIAVKNNIKIVVQCKLYTGTVGNDAVQQVYTAQNFQSAQAAIVVTNSTFSKSARQASATTGVHLIHHSQLIETANGIYNQLNNAGL